MNDQAPSAESPISMAPTAKVAARRRWRTVILTLSLVVAVAASVAGLWVRRQSSKVPEFYTRAFERSPTSRDRSRSGMKRAVARLQEDVSRRGEWQASFDEERINAWLSEELPQKFARLLAHGASDPAVAIQEGQLMAAVRYTSSRWNTVISCRLSVEMTEQPNLLAIRLFDLKAGALPLPLDPFVRKISFEAALGDLDIRWDFTESGPVALVTIPAEDPRYACSPVVIESVDLASGQLRVAGRTGTQATTHYAPRGPVHRFVSFRIPPRSANSTPN